MRDAPLALRGGEGKAKSVASEEGVILSGYAPRPGTTSDADVRMK